MDPLTALFLGANFVALSDNIYRGLKFIRRAHKDSRIDGLYVRLITEQASYAEWKRRMGIENEDDFNSLLENIPENARKSLTIILAPMEKYLKEASEMFIKYGIDEPGPLDRRIGLKDKLKRLDYLLVGEKELTNLLNTLKNCNDGLLTIAPPAPGYYVSLSSNDTVLETSQPTQQPQNRELSQFRQTRSRLPQAEVRHMTSQDQTSPIWDDIASKQKDNRGTKISRPVIERLYSTSLDVLRTAILQYPAQKSSFEGIFYRLSLWGSGMFQGLITIDQALNQRSDCVNLLKNNIAGTLAEIAITLGDMISILGESTNSTLVQRLNALFSTAEISRFPLDDEPTKYDQDSGDNQSLLLESCTQELSDLIECLFWTLPTIEMVFKTVLARQTQNPALDERQMWLLKSESDISLSNMGSEPTRELLKVDLALIAAMRESLKDTKYVKYLEQREPTFDPKQLYKELGEESAQVKYWTSKIAEEKHGITEETQAAMTLNLARIARVFNAGYKPSNSKKPPPDTDMIQDMIRRCRPYTSDDETDESAISSPPLVMGGDSNPISAALDVLKSSNVELRRIAGFKDPGMSYQKDFSLSEKNKEHEALNEPSFHDLESTA